MSCLTPYGINGHGCVILHDSSVAECGLWDSPPNLYR